MGQLRAPIGRFIAHPWGFWLAFAAISLVVSGLRALLHPRALPLDDAWIYLTYARSLGTGQGFRFDGGFPSAGVSSFLWPMLLVPGPLLHAPVIWAIVAGVVSATVLAATSALLVFLETKNGPLAVVTGGIVLLEGHLAWAAHSGMETLAFASVLMVAVLARPHGGRAGVAAAIAILLRPEGVFLLVLLAIPALQRRDVRYLLRYSIGSASVLALFVTILVALGGPFIPTTGAAKFAFYAHSDRLGYLLAVGTFLLTTPIPVIWLGMRRISGVSGIAVAFFLANVALGLLKLPVLYQHGRYLMPAIPLLIVGGFIDCAPGTMRRTQLALAMAIGLTLAGIPWSERAITQDTQLISGTQEAIAHWIRANPTRRGVVASHDIGVLGYFLPDAPVDLVGLTDPNVVPLERDPRRLAAYVRQRHARYLMLFDGSYTQLLQQLPVRAVDHVEPIAARGTDWPPMTLWEIEQTPSTNPPETRRNPAFKGPAPGA